MRLSTRLLIEAATLSSMIPRDLNLVLLRSWILCGNSLKSVLLQLS